MRKIYEEPEMIIHNYSLSQTGIVMTSGTTEIDLEDGDNYDLFK